MTSKMEENSDFLFSYDHPIYDFHEIVYNQDIEELSVVSDVVYADEAVPQSQSVINEPQHQIKHCQLLPIKQIPKRLQSNKKSNGEKKKQHDKINNNHEKPAKISENLERNVNNSDSNGNCTSFEEILYRNENFISQFTKKGHKNTILDDSIVNVLEKFITDFSPLNRFSWKIFQKLNVSSHKFSKQYIIVNGRDILLSGNIGGEIRDVVFKSIIKKRSNKVNKVEEKHTTELVKTKLPTPKKRVAYKRKGLLTYMNVKLKPGPLCKKPKLNDSEHDIGLGKIELVKIPPVGLVISPSIGCPLDVNVCANLKRVRNSQGFIDAPWANFASSTLDDKASTKNISHTFIIPYENNQSRILMRRDLDTTDYLCKKNISKEHNIRSSISDLNTPLEFLDNYKPKNSRDETVRSVLSDILKMVCIGEVQDSICKYDPSDVRKTDDSLLLNNKIVFKKKGIRRKYVNELKKLNVTVIDIGGEALKENCNNDFCKLGCVCNSLNTNYFLNDHCGSPECMFDCTCNLEDDKSSSDICSPEKSPKISQSAVLNLHHQVNRNLSKEEKKFHRTVIRSDDQTILLGAKRRGVKMPKRFEDYNNPFSKEKYETPKDHQLGLEVKIILPKLPNFVNTEPWCMVHQLYRCFCKGLLVDGGRFGFSTTYNNQECQRIIDNTLSLQRNVDIKVVTDIPCSRTTYNPTIMKIVNAKKISYLNRNNNIRLSEDIFKDINALDMPSTKILESDINNGNENIDHSNLTNGKIVNDKQTVPVISNSNKTDFTKMCGIICSNVDKLRSKTKCLISPIENEFHAISLSSIISNNCLQKIFIWLTVKSPYLQYITLDDNISCPHACVNIKYADKKLIDMHPPFMKEIVSYKISKDYHCLLLGKSFAWQIFGISEYQKSSNDTSQSTVSKISKPKDMPITSKLHITKKKVSTAQPGPSQNNSLSKVVKLKKDVLIKAFPSQAVNNKYWLLILIGKDFRGINVHKKRFNTNIVSIQVAVTEAQKSKEFIRIPSKNIANPNEKVHFGLYAAPYHGKNCVFLGPYKFSDAVEIEIDDHNPHSNQSRVSWLYPSNIKLYAILDALSNKILKKHICNSSSLNSILQSRARTVLKPILVDPSTSKTVENDIHTLVNSAIENGKFINLIDLKSSATFQNSSLKTSRNKSSLNNSVKQSTKRGKKETSQRSKIDDEDDDVIILPSKGNEVLEISDSE